MNNTLKIKVRASMLVVTGACALFATPLWAGSSDEETSPVPLVRTKKTLDMDAEGVRIRTEKMSFFKRTVTSLKLKRNASSGKLARSTSVVEDPSDPALGSQDFIFVQNKAADQQENEGSEELGPGQIPAHNFGINPFWRPREEQQKKSTLKRFFSSKN